MNDCNCRANHNYARNRCNSGNCCPCCCEMPVGPSIGSIIPYSFSYLYLATFEPEFFIDTDTFILPRNGTLCRIVLALDVFDFTIDAQAIGTVEFRIYTSPIFHFTPTLVATGHFTPSITSTTSIESVLVANKPLNIPVKVTDRVALALSYFTNDGSQSFLNANLHGGLLII